MVWLINIHHISIASLLYPSVKSLKVSKKKKKANDTAGNITSDNTVASVLPCVPLEQSYRNQLADISFIYGTINTAKLIIAFTNSKYKLV